MGAGQAGGHGGSDGGVAGGVRAGAWTELTEERGVRRHLMLHEQGRPTVHINVHTMEADWPNDTINGARPPA